MPDSPRDNQPNSDDDRESVERFAAASSAAMELLQRHESQLRQHAVRLCFGDQVDADDAMQNLSRALLTRGRTFDPNKGDWVGWAYGILRNLILAERRKTSRFVELTDEIAVTLTDDAQAERAVCETFQEIVDQFFSRLNFEDQQLVTWYWLDGLTAREIADKTGTDQEQIYARVRPLREELQELRTRLASKR